MTAPDTVSLEVIEPGPLATVQDSGRPGHGHLGVGRAGAADRPALAAANRLVGNAPGAAAVETTLGGLTVRALHPLTVAVAGPVTTVTVDGTPAGSHGRIRLAAGSRLTIAAPPRGLRNYLAVRGAVTGIRTRDGSRHAPELGSMSTDTLSGLGPPPLHAGDTLATDAPTRPLPSVDLIPSAPITGGPPRLPVLPGPRNDRFRPDALQTLTTATWTVTDDADRVGARLVGPLLERAGAHELASEPVVPGALQVPPNGQPVLFLADHPVTGGYPVIAVLRRTAIAAAAQLRPGDEVRFDV